MNNNKKKLLLKQDILEFDKNIELTNAFCETGDSYVKNNLAMTAESQFTIRTTKPSASDEFAKCYIRKTAGWSGAIIGSPTDSDCNVLSNCVGYAQGRFCEIYNEINHTTGNKYKYFNCNAKNFIDRAKDYYPELVIGDEPKPGSILVMGHDTRAGHVLIVERVNSDGSIYTSESAWGGTAFFNKTRQYNDGHWGMDSGYYQLGFIYNPAVKDVEPQPEPTFNIGDHVIANGLLYNSSTAKTAMGHADNVDTHVTRYYAPGIHKYNTTGDLGWMDASDLTLVVDPTMYNISTIAPKNGELSVSKTEAEQGDTITVSVKANSQYKLTLLTYNNISIINNQFIMPAENVVIEATFELIKYSIICNEAEHGKISCAVATAAFGDIVGIDNTPDDGYELATMQSEQVELTEDFRFSMPENDVEITATFKKIDNPLPRIIALIKKLIQTIWSWFKK